MSYAKLPLLVLAATLLSAGSLACKKNAADESKSKPSTILNVSFDPTRELYQNYNTLFAKHWKDKTGQDVTINQSHGGSGKQARAVADGIPADVVTLALAYDVNSLVAANNLIKDATWQKRLPNNSCPYVSTIVLLVRKSNPKNIKDWDDLTQTGISVVTPSPKTSGGARWNYLAAWGFAKDKFGSDDAAQAFVKKIYQNVAALDSGARDATNRFTHDQQGDVLIAWESEALLTVHNSPNDYEIVRPSESVLAEPPVSVIDANVDAHNTRAVSEEYLSYLYSDDAQELIAQNFYRPTNPAILVKHTDLFPTMNLFNVNDKFGGWDKAQSTHFADKGTFDQIEAK